MTLTIEEIKSAIDSKKSYAPTDLWPASLARSCAVAMKAASQSKAKKPRAWGAVRPVKDPKKTYAGLFLLMRNKLVLWSEAPESVDELFVPWGCSASPRYWLYPLVGRETVGGDVSAIAAVTPGDNPKVYAIYKNPAEELPLFPFQEYPNKLAIRQTIAQIHKHAKDRWGSDTVLRYAETDTGYHRDIMLAHAIEPGFHFEPLSED